MFELYPHLRVAHLCGHCVQNLPVLEDDEPGHVGHDLPLAELLAHVDLQHRSQSKLSTDLSQSERSTARSSQPITAQHRPQLSANHSSAPTAALSQSQLTWMSGSHICGTKLVEPMKLPSGPQCGEVSLITILTNQRRGSGSRDLLSANHSSPALLPHQVHV